MDILFSAFFFLALSVILIIPFGMAVLYVALSLVQLFTAAKEKSRVKQKGAVIALIIACGVLSGVFYFWWPFMRNLME